MIVGKYCLNSCKNESWLHANIPPDIMVSSEDIGAQLICITI